MKFRAAVISLLFSAWTDGRDSYEPAPPERPALKPLLLFLLLAVQVTAESFPIGTGELGPAVGTRYLLAAGASDSGYLVAWGDGRPRTSVWNQVYVARLDRNGVLLDPEGVAVMDDFEHPQLGDTHIASDGSDFLLVRTKFGQSYAVRVTRDSVSAARRLPFEAPLIALEWNGRHYVALLYNYATYRVEALLLERDGRVASGRLDVGLAGRLACRRGECLVAGADGTRQIRGGVITEAMFPPAGAPAAAYALSPLFPGATVLLAATATGYVTVTESRHWEDRAADGVTVRSHAAGSLAVESQFRTGAIPVIASDAQIVGTGMLLELTYVSFAGERYRARLGPRGAYVEPLPWRSARVISGGPAGPLAVWINYPSFQLHYALRGGWAGDGELLSRSRALELRPRLARGTASVLAAWTERRTTDTLYVRMLDAGGRPRTAPVALRRAPIVAEALVAFDGVHYLAVWEERADRDAVSRVHARFITQDGELAGEQLTIATTGGSIGSLLWNGRAYALTAGPWLIHLGTSGAELGRKLSPAFGNYLFLQYDPQRNEYAGLDATTRHSQVASTPGFFVKYHSVAISADQARWSQGDCCTARYLLDGVWSWAAPAIGIRGDGAAPLIVTFDEVYGFMSEPEERQSLPFAITDPSRVHAERAGNEFVVGAGSVLARFSLDGKLLEQRLLAADGVESALLAGERSTLVLVQRGRWGQAIPRIEAFPVER